MYAIAALIIIIVNGPNLVRKPTTQMEAAYYPATGSEVASGGKAAKERGVTWDHIQ